jgi:hypothetical protein
MTVRGRKPMRQLARGLELQAHGRRIGAMNCSKSRPSAHAIETDRHSLWHSRERVASRALTLRVRVTGLVPVPERARTPRGLDALAPADWARTLGSQGGHRGQFARTFFLGIAAYLAQINSAFH